MENSNYLIPWVRVLLGALPYIGAVTVHVFSVYKIWDNKIQPSNSWWSSLLTAPLISVLYPISRFSKAFSSWEASLTFLGIGLGLIFLVVLALLTSRILTVAQARMPSPVKLPFKGYLLWNELLLVFSTLIIVFEMVAAMIISYWPSL